MLKRSFVLGNGKMLVGFDMHGQVKDFYYPYVGLENHVSYTHRIGFWVNGRFVWIDDEGWEKELSYKKNTLVTDIRAAHADVPFKIELNDAVHYEDDILVRKMMVINSTDAVHKVRVFFNQTFEIYGTPEANTAYYNPYVHALVHYKRKRYFLINGYVDTHGKPSFTNYAIGVAGRKEYEGSWADAQDGVLSNNPIEHGPVDSTIAFDVLLQPHQRVCLYYWICVGINFDDVCSLNDSVHEQLPAQLIDQVKEYWIGWSGRTRFVFKGLSEQVVDQFHRSLLIVRVHADNHGAFIASTDSDTFFHWRDTYNYMWPRDGALIARSIDRAGYDELTSRFFKFCERALTKQGYLLHKYCPDGSVGSSWHPWIYEGKPQLPIQEDQVGLIIDAFWKHYVQSGKEEVASMFHSFVRPVGAFLREYIDKKTGLVKQSYDLWEEKLGVHTWTCATVYAGLHAAAHFEQEFGDNEHKEEYIATARTLKKAVLAYLYDDKEEYFIKRIYYQNGELKRDTLIDASSAYGMFHFKLISPHDERITKSYDRYVRECSTPIGGFMRYPRDIYFRLDAQAPSNAWYITTLWLAEYYIAKAKNDADLEPARALFNWVIKYTPSTGILSEQLNPYTGDSVSVAPLTWSHATFIITVNKYLEKLEELDLCKMCNPPQMAEKLCSLCTGDQ